MIMTITVECEKTGKTFSKEISKEQLTVVDSEKRKMGDEKHFELTINGICPHCKQKINKIDIFEYPEGIYTSFVE